jgi:propionyl-CoA carboxylase beta chain
VTAEDLGGASVHTVKSSVADKGYDNDVEALLQMRRLFDFLPASNMEEAAKRADQRRWRAHRQRRSTRIIPANPNQPYDMKELIHKTVDEGDFFEIQEAHAKNIVVGFARMEGHTVGVVANQPMVLAGVLDMTPAARRRGSCASATASTFRW